MRCPGRPALDDPASAFSRRCASRASAEGSPSARRPCGFSLCEHDAVKLDMRNCRLRVLHFSRCAASSRRAQWCFAMSATLRSPVRTAVGESDSIVRYERPVTSSATASLIRHSPAVMHRRVPLARCSATTGEPSRPGRTRSPSLSRPAALLGFLRTLRRLAPAAGGRPSLVARAHMPFLQLARPD